MITNVKFKSITKELKIMTAESLVYLMLKLLH
jgi:hypothetical protein